MKKSSLSADESALFNELMRGTRKLKQDTVQHNFKHKVRREVATRRLSAEQTNSSYYFSDQFHPLLPSEGPVRYLRADVDHYQLKKLRRGDFSPEIFLDMHGLTQRQAKQELGALIAACLRDHLLCASVMHGYGRHILKHKTPLWLAQHPDILAFHQAPEIYGGNAALLVLVDVDSRSLALLRS